jgi:2-polyprenyl-6-methoxyphenol hydroxylase-like FAD-dependent oxidoreductase
MSDLRVRCCIVGGGPAGMMLGFLLARAGIDIAVLEKHADFLRDFRGDTIHPSTLEVMHELGLLEEFLRRPHQEISQMSGQIGDQSVMIADLTHLPTRCKFVAFMPQWDFLNFLAEHGRRLPGFGLKMETDAVDLIREGDKVVGVRATTPQGPLEIRCDLVVGADGRHSTVRAKAGLAVLDIGAPMDVLWLRVSRQAEDPRQVLGRIDAGRIFVMLDRNDYWQCAYVIPKGSVEAVRARGIEAFRASVAAIAPFLGDRVNELKSWDDIKLLTVAVDRLRDWHQPGLLCIGDAAHAMSPIGGVGINLAIQDAVATANLLTAPLQRGTPSEDDLRRVQRRREWPTRMTQGMQVMVQNRMIGPVLATNTRPPLPWPVKLLRAWPFLRRIPARIVGMGFRPEHVAKV